MNTWGYFWKEKRALCDTGRIKAWLKFSYTMKSLLREIPKIEFVIGVAYGITSKIRLKKYTLSKRFRNIIEIMWVSPPITNLFTRILCVQILWIKWEQLVPYTDLPIPFGEISAIMRKINELEVEKFILRTLFETFRKRFGLSVLFN